MPLFDDLKLDANGLITVVVTDTVSRDVLMVAYMNREALERTIATGDATYWSRSRQQFWVKGATSGNVQRVVALRRDCDGDALLLEVEQTGAACHEGYRSCFSRRLAGESWEVTEERLCDSY
ncbi:MAG: phosphoribosyl-AMP cyclohydrolase [Armatimonadetes bacterium]|nr:phosphoribosyl-AMP cyclohydrolase [Armatimonadota bacterium]